MFINTHTLDWVEEHVLEEYETRVTSLEVLILYSRLRRSVTVCHWFIKKRYEVEN